VSDIDPGDDSLPRLADHALYPNARDVLDALWLFEDLAEDAERSGRAADARRLHTIADLARGEYRRRAAEERALRAP
jgi:hypothetical protein